MSNTFVVSTALEGRKKLLISIVSWLCVQFFDDSFTMITANLIGKTFSEVSHNFKVHYILMLITLLICTVISQAVMHLRKRNTQDKVDIKNSDYFSFLRLGIIIFALLAVVIMNNASKKYYENSSHMQGKMMDMQKAYYEEMLLREQETKKFRHDINNHMLCLRSLIDSGNYTEAEKYISDLCSRISTLRNKYSTGNELVNAIVNDTASRYESVKLTWNGILSDELNISNMEICIIFSNLLDNAFCAASKCHENGRVDVEVKTVTNSLLFTVKNNIAEPVTTMNSKLITSKPDKKNHGFGTMNVKECAAAIGGSVDYKFTDSDFTAEVILPNVIIQELL